MMSHIHICETPSKHEILTSSMGIGGSIDIQASYAIQILDQIYSGSDCLSDRLSFVVGALRSEFLAQRDNSGCFGGRGIIKDASCPDLDFVARNDRP